MSSMRIEVTVLLFASAVVGCRREGERSIPTMPPTQDTLPAPPAAAPPAQAPTAEALPIEAASGQSIALVYSSNLRGQYEPWGRPAHALGGLARRAALVAAIEKEAQTVLQVDAGDLLLPPAGQLVYLDEDPAERERRAGLVLAAYARLGVQAVVPGETDLALGARRLVALASQTGVPFLCANLVDAEGKPLLPASRAFDLGGVSAGVFGLLVAPPADLPRLRRDSVRLTDPAEAGRAASASLRAAGATIVIGLFHLEGGVAQARALATAIGGIDVVVLGHGGTTTETLSLTSGGTTRIVEAGVDGKHLGRLDLGTAHNQLYRIDSSRGESRAVATMVAKHTRERRQRTADGRLAAVDPRFANLDYPQPRSKGGKPQPPLRESWTYGSTAACAGCHAEETAQWKETAHAFGLETLKSRKRDRDPDCLPCHTTAFLRPGGTHSLATALQYFPEVGCESCHGPSVAHMRAPAKKTGTQRATPEPICRDCHPREATSDFDYARDVRATLGPGHGI